MSSLIAATLALPTLIVNCRVVDVRAGIIREGQAVKIIGNRIAYVRPRLEVPSDDPMKCEVIDAKGAYLMPGLTDCHVHLNNPIRETRLMLAHGVTSAREMAGTSLERVTLRDQINADPRLGFHFITTGAILDGEKPYHPGSIACATPESAIQAANDQIKAKVDMLKVYGLLTPEAFRAIAKVARAKRIPFGGHVPDSMTVIEAANEGMATMEHLYRCVTLLDDLVPAFKPNPARFEGGIFDRWAEVNRSKLRERLQMLNRTKMAICPTMILFEGQGRLPVSDGRMKEWQAYASPGEIDGWTSPIPEQYAEFGKSLQSGWNAMGEFVKSLDQAGVPLLVGTDLGNGYTLAGRAVWDEMDHLSKAGLSNAAVLRAATLRPSEVLPLPLQGEVVAGNRADLLLLTANPLQDLRAIRSLRVVWANGVRHNRQSLDRLLKEAQKDRERDSATAIRVAPLRGPDIKEFQHFFQSWPDTVEQVRVDAKAFQSTFLSLSYGRTPLSSEGKSIAPAYLEISLLHLANKGTVNTFRVGERQKVQFLASPTLGAELFQWEAWLKNQKLPVTLRTLVYKSRQVQYQDLMVLEVNPTDPTGSKVRLRSLRQPDFSINYRLDENRHIIRRGTKVDSFVGIVEQLVHKE